MINMEDLDLKPCLGKEVVRHTMLLSPPTNLPSLTVMVSGFLIIFAQEILWILLKGLLVRCILFSDLKPFNLLFYLFSF